ncbi:hypothetical protein WDU94_009923 [Cyamophila willieti]
MKYYVSLINFFHLFIISNYTIRKYLRLKLLIQSKYWSNSSVPSSSISIAFSYWPPIETRSGAPNIYEVRSYSLKPGTMIEWGNNWARAISHRRNNDEAFAGFFSQVGRLYNVHHFWCYKDLSTRKETRESAWRSPGWDECVAYTVPLIREMQTRLLLPTSFSPTQ